MFFYVFCERMQRAFMKKKEKEEEEKEEKEKKKEMQLTGDAECELETSPDMAHIIWSLFIRWAYRAIKNGRVGCKGGAGATIYHAFDPKTG